MENKNGAAEVADINKEIDDRFRRVENKLMMLEMRYNRAISKLENDVFLNNIRIRSSIINSPFYKWDSLDSFMRDYIGDDYCKDYTKKDWELHYSIQSMKDRSVCRS